MSLKAKPEPRQSEALDKVVSELQKEDTQRLNVNIPKSMLLALKMKAISEGKPMTKLIIALLKGYLSDN